MLFIDRKNELNMLSSAYNRSRAEFILITGRRRIGKTELIKKCINEHKGVLFIQHNLQLQPDQDLFLQWKKVLHEA